MLFQFWRPVAAGLIGSIITEMLVYMQKGVSLDVKQNIFPTWGTMMGLHEATGLYCGVSVPRGPECGYIRTRYASIDGDVLSPCRPPVGQRLGDHQLAHQRLPGSAERPSLLRERQAALVHSRPQAEVLMLFVESGYPPGAEAGGRRSGETAAGSPCGDPGVRRRGHGKVSRGRVGGLRR
jgi:hypothetical protein